MKYIHYFDTIENHDKVYYGDGYKEPWLALTEQENKLTYNKHVTLTFEAISATTVPIYYTKESYINSKPDLTIELKPNERKTTTINKSEIYRFGVTQYDTTTLKRTSVNTAITFVGVKGTVLDEYRLFDGANGLIDTDLSYMDTFKIINMQAMFQNCSSLKSLDVSKWNTSNVTDMSYMFKNCTSLTTVKVTNCSTETQNKFLKQLQTDLNSYTWTLADGVITRG